MSQINQQNQNEVSQQVQDKQDSRKLISLLSSPQLQLIKSNNSKSNNTTQDMNEQITSLHASQVFQINSQQKLNLEQEPELIRIKSSQGLNSSQGSLQQINLNPSQSQNLHEENSQLQNQKYHLQLQENIEPNQQITPSNQKMSPNFIAHRLQILQKKQTNWSLEIDLTKYKPHQIHQKIDNIALFDQNLENKDAVDILKCILVKQPSKRNAKEIQFVRKCLRNVKFFNEIEKQLPEELILRLCKFITYEKHPQFHRLYKAGDYGRKFYIILEGAVFILTPSISKTFDQSITDNKEEKQIKQMIMHEFEETPRFFPLPQNLDENADDSQLIQSVVQLQNEGFNIKKTLEKGESFGEIALRTEGIRTASVVCREDTHFVSITATTYNEVIDAYHDLLYKEKIDFLRNVSIFQRWSLAFVHEIMMQVEIKQFKRGDILYEEGEKSKNLYFVRSGEVELQQTVEIKDSLDNFKSIPDKLVKSNHVWNEKIKNSKLKKCSLVILGPYQYFGDYEIFKKSKRITRAVCYSNSELFVLEKKEFFENMQFINMVKEIHNLFKEREIWYQGMIQKNLNTEAQIHKIIQNQKRQQSLIETNPVEEEKSRRVSFIQELSQKNIIMPISQEERSKYTKVQIDSLRNITEEIDKYQQNSFLEKINIYKEFKSPKNQEQELFNDQIKIKQKNQIKQMKQEQAIQNVIRLKQFVGKSMNLINQIQSIKKNDLDYRQRKSEQLLSTQQDSLISFQEDSFFHKNYEPSSTQSKNQLPQSSTLQIKIKHNQSKSAQSLINSIDLLEQNNGQQNQKAYLQSRNSIVDQILHNNLSPRNFQTNKKFYQLQNQQKQQENNSQIQKNLSPSPYQIRTVQNQPISSLFDHNKISRASLQDIDGLMQSVEKNVIYNKYQALHSDDNLGFIKSQIDANKKNVIRQKMQYNFTHKYLDEKTGRYKLPSKLQIPEQEHLNILNLQSSKDMSNKISVSSTKNNQNQQIASFNQINTPHTVISSNNIDKNSSKESLSNSRQESPVKKSQLSLPTIIVSPKLINKEINFSKSYKKGKIRREQFDGTQKKRILKLS
ncbi:cyclic nucleotide-binding domain protein (macronuclear) [Tetrahymena thermophila SB210]|uniref:Cyclic nucleotide-binding domain protein n=1 Tax=Tetrahymena thermophila (strain SB210) TaxID=312017 RepID=Q24BY1_TETTS|nr:cyclic nucleotide-binding domain protein [Tetrahymena thermophila SB210]EAS05256.2 cyclic nucleotide-binding domain protein [Tetrahymena thermophila SB210]|eukprot:XP_001025501.2 cyclic nucleotide-binding domain protein [Tetrahymena thermophila SB210]